MKYALSNKQIVLGVTGGIAAYKSADLVRRLREASATVRVVMTEHAKEFITPLTMQAVSGSPVHDDLFDLKAEAAMGHIELARWADALVVAPASADFMARLNHGEANDLLTTLCLATKAPLIIAPAMNQGMWRNALTEANARALLAKGIHLAGPLDGNQACGDVGPGRMMEPTEIVEKIIQLFQTSCLAGKNVLITAGPTHEAIDPVRFMTNGSSGKMGYALADAAIEAGANVTLISGPVKLSVSNHVKMIHVISAKEMFDAVMSSITEYDLFFSVAAVGDYALETIATQKIPKKDNTLTLTLKRNPDIVATVAALDKKPITIGFAAETHDLLEHAQAKRLNKRLDMIIANQVGEGFGIGSDYNTVTALWGNQQREFPHQSKHKLARELIAFVAETFP